MSKYKCTTSVMSLDPTGNYGSTGACPASQEEFCPDTGGGDEEPGGDGRWRVAHFDSMDKLNTERNVFKGTASF